MELFVIYVYQIMFFHFMYINSTRSFLQEQFWIQWEIQMLNGVLENTKILYNSKEVQKQFIEGNDFI